MKNILIMGLCILLIGIVIIFAIVYAINNMDFNNDEASANNKYIQNIDMDYIEKDGVQFKVDYLSMNETNLDIVFNFKMQEDTSNYEGISLPMLLITDEEGRQIFLDTEEEAHYKNYARVMGSRPIENRDNTIRQLSFLTARDEFPNSKKLYISFDTIILYNVNQGNPFTKELKGEWKLELDINKPITNNTVENQEFIQNTSQITISEDNVISTRDIEKTNKLTLAYVLNSDKHNYDTKENQDEIINDRLPTRNGIWIVNDNTNIESKAKEDRIEFKEFIQKHINKSFDIDNEGYLIFNDDKLKAKNDLTKEIIKLINGKQKIILTIQTCYYDVDRDDPTILPNEYLKFNISDDTILFVISERDGLSMDVVVSIIEQLSGVTIDK